MTNDEQNNDSDNPENDVDDNGRKRDETITTKMMR